jgi:PIN domain nuclease of toxin-antitoxin system
MKILLDTHTALWWVNEHEKLSPEARTILLNEANLLFISIVSIWEIAIKVSLGKLLELDGGVKTFLEKLDTMLVYLLPIATRHVEMVEALPFLHRDPFDRLLVASAVADGLTVLTADCNIHKYDVLSLW